SSGDVDSRGVLLFEILYSPGNGRSVRDQFHMEINKSNVIFNIFESKLIKNNKKTPKSILQSCEVMVY
ncbi:MAG: hypothetical protein IJI30_01900, partial [Lachnospiraceae bacterium]|nr:hypothetical protein [Lachnospiraceae bacterium]